MFAAGGFLFLNERGLVLGVQALVTGEGYDNQLVFGAPQTWRREFTEQVRPPPPPPLRAPRSEVCLTQVARLCVQLSSEGRFQPVTLPMLLRAGAKEFCWINPGAPVSRA